MFRPWGPAWGLIRSAAQRRDVVVIRPPLQQPPRPPRVFRRDQPGMLRAERFNPSFNIPPATNSWVLNMPLLEHMLAIAESMERGLWDRARQLLELLSERVSRTGDSATRVAFCFFEALVFRYSRLRPATGTIEYSPTLSENPTSDQTLAAYFALNTVTPFLHFAHLTANQALLEALTGDGEEFLHIVDVDIAGHGAQWPYFLQALAEKRSKEGYPIKRVRITGIGKDRRTLDYTGAQLSDYARSLDLPVEFISLVQDLEEVTPTMFAIEDGEAVGVNCMMQLHTLLRRGPEMLQNFLSMLESFAPKVVTLTEAEADFNEPTFFGRFSNAVTFYTSIFEILDATLPASSTERARVENEWYRVQIRNVVAFEEPERFVCHQPFRLWERFLCNNGFQILPPSWWALSQARCLLKLHYPADGFRVGENNGAAILGWKNRPLVTVSAWRLADMVE